MVKHDHVVVEVETDPGATNSAVTGTELGVQYKSDQGVVLEDGHDQDAREVVEKRGPSR